ncbi:MAG: alternative oxidase [Myxococcota bacterium]
MSMSALDIPVEHEAREAEMTSRELEHEQRRTLETDPMKYSLISRLLFLPIDLLYGRKGDLRKFHVLEVVARVPYQAWESVGYVAITHAHAAPGFAKRVFDFVIESRRQQDNEQWHLLVLEEMIRKRELKKGFLRYRLIPQLLAFGHYHLSWLLYAMKPRWSYRLNAEFEDHAEREYMKFVEANPELAAEPWETELCREYGNYATIGDVLRRIAVDEREHKEESLLRLDAPRFGLEPGKLVRPSRLRVQE